MFRFFPLSFLSLLLLSGAVLPAQIQNGSPVIGTLVLRDETANQVLDLLGEFTGRSIIRQQGLPNVTINFNSRTELTLEEAILALESLLSANGIVVTDMGGSFIKAVPSAMARTQAPSLVEGRSRDLSPSLRVESQFFRLQFLTAEQALGQITQILNPTAAAITFPASNAILVTDVRTNLQRVEEVLAEVDRPSQVQEVHRFFKLRNTRASELQQRLNQLAQGNLRRYFTATTTFEADDRSNQLIVFTNPAFLPLIEELVRSLDVDVAPLTASEVFFIKHAEATELTELITQVINRQREGRQRSEGGTGRTLPGRSPGANIPAVEGQPAPPPAEVVAAVLNLEGGSDSSSANLQFSDFASLVADERSNAIVAYGTPSDLRYVAGLIEQIDILLAQVRIEAVIAEVTLNESQGRGIDSFRVNYEDLGEIEFGVDGPGFTIGGTLRDFTLETVFRTARQNSNVRVLSTPSVTTTHNREAVINVGERRPVITGTQSDSISGGIRSQVDFRPIGIELKVRPLIGNNGVIQLEIEQRVENVVSTVTIDGNELPVIGTREANSFVNVGDGEVVILGGLQEIEQGRTRGRLALFGDIPVIGGIFGSSNRRQLSRELIIFIRPTLLGDTAASDRSSRQRIQKLEPESREAIERFLEEGMFRPQTPEVRPMQPTFQTSPRGPRSQGWRSPSSS
jgi:general secretion pathway protein D